MTTITYNGQPLQATQVKMDINRDIESIAVLENSIPVTKDYLMPISMDATIKISDDNLNMLSEILKRRKIVFNCTQDMMDSLRVLKPKSSITFECGNYKVPCTITRRDYKRNKLYLLETTC